MLVSLFLLRSEGFADALVLETGRGACMSSFSSGSFSTVGGTLRFQTESASGEILHFAVGLALGSARTRTRHPTGPDSFDAFFDAPSGD
jgi:hypothetical protein